MFVDTLEEAGVEVDRYMHIYNAVVDKCILEPLTPFLTQVHIHVHVSGEQKTYSPPLIKFAQIVISTSVPSLLGW